MSDFHERFLRSLVQYHFKKSYLQLCALGSPFILCDFYSSFQMDRTQASTDLGTLIQTFAVHVLLLKIQIQFLPNDYETLSKLSTHKCLILTEFHNHWVKIVDFVIKAYVLRKSELWCPSLYVLRKSELWCPSLYVFETSRANFHKIYKKMMAKLFVYVSIEVKKAW